MTEYLTVFNQILSSRHNDDLSALAEGIETFEMAEAVLQFKLS